MDMVLRFLAFAGIALVVFIPFWYASRKKPSHRDRDHNLSPPEVSSGADANANFDAFIHH